MPDYETSVSRIDAYLIREVALRHPAAFLHLQTMTGWFVSCDDDTNPIVLIGDPVEAEAFRARFPTVPVLSS